MMNGKKGIVYSTIIGLVIGAFFIIAGILLIRSIINATTMTEDSLQQFDDALKEVRAQDGLKKMYHLKLDEESAIVGLNPGKDFLYLHDNMESTGKSWANEGVYMKRPAQCDADKTCICALTGVYFTGLDKTDPLLKGPYFSYLWNSNTRIAFEKAKCSNIEDIKFPEKSYMLDVFIDRQREYDSDPPRSTHYWDGSIILLRSSEINPTKMIDTDNLLSELTLGFVKSHAPLIVAGYRDMYPLEVLDVVLINAGNGVVKVCLKGDLNQCK